MTGTGTGARSAVRTLVEAARRRVRLRTRLRRLRHAWRSRFPRRLPTWPDDHPPTQPPATRQVDGRIRVVPAGGNPQGRQRYTPQVLVGELTLEPGQTGPGRWRIRLTDGRVVAAGWVGQPLESSLAAALTRIGGVTCRPAPHDPPGAWARLVAQLATTGLVLHVDPVAAAPWQSWLAPSLMSLLVEPLPPTEADPMNWELRSVRQRRVALREHGDGPTPPSVSALLVTKRPELVPGVLTTLAGQTYPQLEIVVAVHGGPEPELPASLDRPVTTLTVPAEQTLGEALSAATAAASGTVVTKVDDDDRYGPEHIWDLVLARQFSGATVVGKGAEFVYLEPKDLTVRRRMGAETFTDTVAGGTIAIDQDALAEVDGWPPVPRSVDRALLDRVIDASGTIYRTHPFGFIYVRHGNGHTWDPGMEYFLRDPVRTWPGLPWYDEFGTQ